MAVNVTVFSAENVSISVDAYSITLTFSGVDKTMLHVVLEFGSNAAFQLRECLRRFSLREEKGRRDPFENLPVGARQMWVDLPY